MKSERFGLLLVGAALLVTAVVVGLWFDRQATLQRTHIRNQGVGLVRVLSSLPYDQLLPKPGRPLLLQTVLQMNRNAELGYGVIVDTHGAKLSEVTTPGTLIPAAPQAADPESWFGERPLISPGDGRTIREFYGPVLNNGEIAGYVRLGFFDASPAAIVLDQLSFAAMLALPVFLLAPLFHFLLKREMRPLRELGERLRQLSVAGSAESSEPPILGDLRDLVGRFARFIEMTHARIHEIEAQRFTAQTNSHMLSYRHEKVESVLHALPEALMVLDDSGVVTFANAKLKALLDVDTEAILGLEAREAVPLPEVAAFLARSTGAHAMRGEALEFSPAADAGRTIAASAYPLFCPRNPGSTLGLLVVFRDVTAESLGRQAGAEFVSRVSHELKSPLNVLKMYSEMLLENAGDSRELRIEAVNVIGDEVERMADLIDNLLNVSKIEQGSIALDRQRVRLRDLLEDVVSTAARNAEGKGIKIQLELPQELSPVLLDKNLFRIAIGNLLGNAVKYNRPDGCVTLSAEEGDTQVAIRVRDTGIGIEREDIARVFDKFYRAANANTAASGHGLGLYLARQIAELHQGSLAVTSEPGQGSEFTMLFRKCDAMAEESVRL
jgi:signal transduction histidine kinase